MLERRPRDGHASAGVGETVLQRLVQVGRDSSRDVYSVSRVESTDGNILCRSSGSKGSDDGGTEQHFEGEEELRGKTKNEEQEGQSSSSREKGRPLVDQDPRPVSTSVDQSTVAGIQDRVVTSFDLRRTCARRSVLQRQSRVERADWTC